MKQQTLKAKNFIAILAGLFLFVFGIFGGLFLVGCNTTPPSEDYNPNKIVLMIGDGMGENHVLCATNYLEKGQSLNMTQLSYSGMVDTSSLTTLSGGRATDSAAAATALATGTRVYNDYVSMDADGNDLETIAEVYHSLGYGVGIVTTDALDEGTPAGFSSHTSNRYNFDQIRQDQYSCGFDLFLGADHYQTKLELNSEGFYKSNSALEDGAGIEGYVYSMEQAKIESAGYIFVDDFVNLDFESEKIWGAFPSISTSRLKAPQDNDFSNKAPSLSQMTEFAIEYMETNFPNGYFLMIENNDIDVKSEEAGKGSYQTGPMVECLLEFDRSIGTVKSTLDNSGEDYALIVTADHATGSLFRESTGENLYSFWSSQHNDWAVPYYIEAKNFSLESEILNTDIHAFMKQFAEKENS